MPDFESTIMDAVLKVLSEKISPKVLKSASTKVMRQKVYKAVAAELFYELLKTGRVDFPAGFGSMTAPKNEGRTVKVFNKKTGEMVEKVTTTRRITYKPGDLVKEFL